MTEKKKYTNCTTLHGSNRNVLGCHLSSISYAWRDAYGIPWREGVCVPNYPSKKNRIWVGYAPVTASLPNSFWTGNECTRISKAHRSY